MHILQMNLGTSNTIGYYKQKKKSSIFFIFRYTFIAGKKMWQV